MARPHGTGESVPPATPQRAVSLHTYLFVVAQSGSELVQQTAAGRDRPWHLPLSSGSEAQNHALHPPLPKDRQTISMEILRHPKEDSCMVAMAQGSPLVGKGGHVRTVPVPVPGWVGCAIHECRPQRPWLPDHLPAINKAGRIASNGFSPKVIWSVVTSASRKLSDTRLQAAVQKRHE